MVDTRTKETTFYKQSGATEFAAQSSAEGKVQEKGYYSSVPIPYNINGVPTYVMSLKDKGGLVKMFAMVSIKDYTTVGVGNSLNEALMAYKAALNSNGTTIQANSKSDIITFKDKIDRFSSDVKNGNTFYYFTVKSISNKIFIGTNLVSQELPLTMPNDEVEFVYDKADESQEIDVSKFNNLMLGKKDSIEVIADTTKKVIPKKQ